MQGAKAKGELSEYALGKISKDGKQTGILGFVICLSFNAKCGMSSVSITRRLMEGELDYKDEFKKFEGRVMHGAAGGNIKSTTEWSNHARWEGDTPVYLPFMSSLSGFS